MRKRPLALIVASCIFLASPAALVYKYFQPGVMVPSIDWLLSGILPVFLCIGLLRVNRIAWYTLFGFVFLWGIRELNWLHLVAYLFSLSYFINPQVKRLYFDPRLQWWRTKRRYEAHGTTIVEKDQKTFYPYLKNISEGGCFLETPHTQEKFDLLSITIPLPNPIPDSTLKLKGEVRWVSSNPEKMGMGIQFVSVSQADRTNLKKFIAQH